MPKFIRARILCDDWPTTSMSKTEARSRLLNHAKKLIEARANLHPATIFPTSTDDDPDWWEVDMDDLLSKRKKEITSAEKSRIFDRADEFVERRDERTTKVFGIRDNKEILEQLARLSRRGRAVAMTRDDADHIGAALHARAPWMSAASCAVMTALRRRAADGDGVAVVPPLILTGPPGIGKSAWARHLAETLLVPSTSVDIGASNGGVFAVAGTERGWASAGCGALTSCILAHAFANPVMIIDEIGLAPIRAISERGNVLPGSIGAIMSMIEPTTARRWTDPYLRVDLDLSRVTWVMTTNDITGVPQPLLDRCRVIECRAPTAHELMEAAKSMGDGRLWEADEAHKEPIYKAVCAEIKRRPRISLRALERMIDSAQNVVDRPPLM